MSVPTSSFSSSATPEPVIYQAPINVTLPTYDWNAPDQRHEFRLFKCQLDTWFQLCKSKAEECLDSLLCILGKDSYTAMDHWVPTDEAHRWINSLIILRAPGMMRSPLEFEYMSLRTSRRDLMNPSINP